MLLETLLLPCRIELAFPNVSQIHMQVTVNKTAQTFLPVKFGRCYINTTLRLEPLK